MQVKVYVPRMVEIPREYLSALADRALDSLGESGSSTAATRGHLVRQAIHDGLLRDLDDLNNEDGTVDLFCDPRGEIPLEIEDRTLTLSELREVLQAQRAGGAAKGESIDGLSSRPARRAA